MPPSTQGYRRMDLRRDLAAGLTTAVMLVPQGMAYAMLAGLPPIRGLYASLLPLVAYSVLGTSRQLSVGPVAMVSLLVSASIVPLAAGDPNALVAYATLLALMVGVLQLGMGLARAGLLVNFLSHPVVTGFTSAAALIIGASQLQHLLGVELPRTHLVHRIIIGALDQWRAIHVPTLAMGGLAVAGLLGMQRFARNWPRALIVVAATTTLTWAAALEARGIRIVGEVPAGLPSLAMPKLSTGTILSLGPTAVAIALVGFMESIAVATTYARKNGYELRPNRELVGLGVANVAAAFTQGFPVTGGFSRTAVNADAGARTGVAGLVTAGVVALALLFMTPLFYFIPNATLAAIVITAVAGLIDTREVRRLWTVKRAELWPLGVTFFGTLALGIEAGIGVGVALTLATFFFRTTRPHVAVLGRLPGTDVYRNVKRHPEAQTVDKVLIVRVDAQFYFGNASFLKETLARLEAEAPEPIDTVIIDASSINQLDSSAESALREIHDGYLRRGVTLLLAGVKGPVQDILDRSGLSERLGRQAFTLRVEDAVRTALSARKNGGATADPSATPPVTP